MPQGENGVDVLTFITDDGGVNYRGIFSIANSGGLGGSLIAGPIVMAGMAGTVKSTVLKNITPAQLELELDLVNGDFVVHDGQTNSGHQNISVGWGC